MSPSQPAIRYTSSATDFSQRIRITRYFRLGRQPGRPVIGRRNVGRASGSCREQFVSPDATQTRAPRIRIGSRIPANNYQPDLNGELVVSNVRATESASVVRSPQYVGPPPVKKFVISEPTTPPRSPPLIPAEGEPANRKRETSLSNGTARGPATPVRRQWGTSFAVKKLEKALGELEEKRKDVHLEELLRTHIDAHGGQPRAARETAPTGQVSTSRQHHVDTTRGDGAQAGTLDASNSSNSGLPGPAKVTFVSRGTRPATSKGMHKSSLVTGGTRLKHRLWDALGNIGDLRLSQYHTSARHTQQAAAAAREPENQYDPSILQTQRPENPNGIRAVLRRWQEVHGSEDSAHEVGMLDEERDADDVTNSLTRLPLESSNLDRPADESEQEREAMAHFMQAPAEEPGNLNSNVSFLRMGDLVEVEYTRSERESVVAIFVRRIGFTGQFYTMQGRWLHVSEKRIQYSIPGWVTPELVRPLLDHLPSAEDVEAGLGKLTEESYMHDISVPRTIAGPLVTRLVQFHTESQEIYRLHAGALDNAHGLLAHDTDLRYGSLRSAASSLLNVPADQLPVTALYAVRQAMTRAGFAFNIDRRSHRVTGYLQIRSKEQVKLVEQVRQWVREWQEDLARKATFDRTELEEHRPSRGAQNVYNFIRKAKRVVQKSRKTRELTAFGTIGPSKTKLPILPGAECIRVTSDATYSHTDGEIIRFMESWCLSTMYVGLPRVEALPPLILQAIGLYDTLPLDTHTGITFLQELGVILPYENRVRFDQHLLLPSSEHSKPLQTLMSKLSFEKEKFPDSMADLRHDWGALPIYCIDKASAHEIDDGLSVESAGVGADGQQNHWVHIHIANPTAFFSRDHPLAKMARHMGESIYMPERAYMMLPRWATQRNFSLGRDRPALTFSVKLDSNGRTIEHKITPGIVRDVHRITPEGVRDLLDAHGPSSALETVLTVGGTPPMPPQQRRGVNDFTRLGPTNTKELSTLSMLAQKRSALRRAAKGVFFDMYKPEVEVWQSYDRPGLAWEHLHRDGSRITEGDPVIQMRTRPLSNWFSPMEDQVETLVREMMLLACETAAKWCDERKIPAVFRGTVSMPDRPDPNLFFQEVLAPAAKKSEDGSFPLHLGLQYMETFGITGLSVKPFTHRILGMDHYGKVTSPLRRYGDMIVHWQIEAALREEAATGRSLVTSDPEPERRFLPFNTTVLKAILVGLQPREGIIMRSKAYAEIFWLSMLMFRAHHFGEAELPAKLTAYLLLSSTKMGSLQTEMVPCILIELNLVASMARPEWCKEYTGEERSMRQGDVWEVKLAQVHVGRRRIDLVPVRLMKREEENERAKQLRREAEGR